MGHLINDQVPQHLHTLFPLVCSTLATITTFMELGNRLNMDILEHRCPSACFRVSSRRSERYALPCFAMYPSASLVPMVTFLAAGRPVDVVSHGYTYDTALARARAPEPMLSPTCITAGPPGTDLMHLSLFFCKITLLIIYYDIY